MLKKVILVGISFLFLSAFIFFTAAQISQPGQNVTIPVEPQLTNQGFNFVTYCTDASCNTTVYSYEKYFNRNGEWEEVDEDWYSCEQGYCTKDYYYNATAYDNGLIHLNLENGLVSYQITSINGVSISNSTPSIENSVLTYENIIPDVDLAYQYLPLKLKEEIIFNEPLANLTEDLEINFAVSDTSSLDMENPFVCDSNRKCITLEHTVSSNEISLTVPSSFMNSETTVYPVIVDPVFYFGYGLLAWNGVVQEKLSYDGQSLVHERFDNPSSLIIGATYNASARGDMDWNLTSIPDMGTILYAILNMYVEYTTAPNFINLTHIEKNSFERVNNQTENENFFNDMRNGTVYYSIGIPIPLGGFAYDFYLNQEAINDITAAFNTDMNFSVGFDTDYSQNITFSARDHPNSNQRPTLILVYDITNSSANAAIERGINNSLPNNPISTSQQVYVVDMNAQHFLGRFDKVTQKNNQTWAFNYINVGLGDSWINMSSLLNIVNVWQSSNLNTTQITSQVEAFINATKI